MNWGIGMIAMPFYLHSAGLVGGLFFFVLSMLLALDAAVVMHKLSERLQEPRELEKLKMDGCRNPSQLLKSPYFLVGEPLKKMETHQVSGFGLV